MPLDQEWNQDRGTSTAHKNTWCASGRSEVSVAQYFAAINTYTYWSHRISPPRCKLSVYYTFSGLVSPNCFMENNKIISGVRISLFRIQEFRNKVVKSLVIQECQSSGNIILILSSPRKNIICEFSNLICSGITVPNLVSKYFYWIRYYGTMSGGRIPSSVA